MHLKNKHRKVPSGVFKFHFICTQYVKSFGNVYISIRLLFCMYIPLPHSKSFSKLENSLKTFESQFGSNGMHSEGLFNARCTKSKI